MERARTEALAVADRTEKGSRSLPCVENDSTGAPVVSYMADGLPACGSTPTVSS